MVQVDPARPVSASVPPAAVVVSSELARDPSRAGRLW